MPPHPLRPRVVVLGSLFTLLTSVAFAQPSATRPPLPNEVSFHYDRAASSEVERGASRGDVGIDSFEFAFQHRRRLASGSALQIGVELKQHSLDVGSLALPDELSSVSLPIGIRTPINADWMLNARLVPALAGDDGIGSGSATLLGVIIGTRQVTPTFSWSFGMIARTHADTKVIPVLGLTWNWAPDWTLIVGAPRTGIRHQLTENIEWGLGASISGGTFHIDSAPAPGLGDTYLDFREIRFGFDAKYDFASTVALEFEAGAIIDRRFEYYERGFEYKGDGSAYVRVGLSLGF